MFSADGLRIGRQIGLREHHTFGYAGSARGVHQQCHGLRCRIIRQHFIGWQRVLIWIANLKPDLTRYLRQQVGHHFGPVRADQHHRAI